MIRNVLWLHFTIFDIDFIPAKNDGNIGANSRQIAMPIGHVFIRNARRDVEENDCAFSADVIAVAQTAELFLTGRVPDVELNDSLLGLEFQRVNFDAQRR